MCPLPSLSNSFQPTCMHRAIRRPSGGQSRSNREAIKEPSRSHQGAIKEPSACSHLECIEFRAVDCPTNALSTRRDGQMMCEDAHEQGAVEGMPCLDEGGEALVCRRQRCNGYVFAAHLPTREPIRDAIRAHQTSSDVLSMHLLTGEPISDAIRAHQRAIRRTQTYSDVLRRNQT